MNFAGTDSTSQTYGTVQKHENWALLCSVQFQALSSLGFLDWKTTETDWIHRHWPNAEAADYVVSTEIIVVIVNIVLVVAIAGAFADTVVENAERNLLKPMKTETFPIDWLLGISYE